MNSVIGQSYIKNMITRWMEYKSFPHFILIRGDEGSGKRTVSRLIALAIGCQLSTIDDPSANGVRELIDIAYQLDTEASRMYLIPDADNMSLAAKNILLKFTEEPPPNAYIVLTLKSLDNMLPTLISRAQTLTIEPYTVEELENFCSDPLYAKIGKTPGMVKYFEAMGEANVNNILTFCDMLITKIDKVSFGNAFKSSQRLKLKAAAKQGYELTAFISGLETVLDRYMQDSSQLNVRMLIRIKCWYKLLAQYKQLVARSTLNKQAIYDRLVLDARELLMNEGA